MAYITQAYNDGRIIAELQKLRPEIVLGEASRVTDVSLAPSSGGRFAGLSVTVEFSVTLEELEGILQNSKVL
ncbi:hypothetical protein E3T46_14865 [Cryobacterium sp. Hh11]|nr:hypothetical protein E3T46_14865 [Cryobacterium sp. Hh11]